MRHILPLNGDGWRFRALPPGRLPSPPDALLTPAHPEWLPAQVPGNVRADLFRLGLIPDPHLRPQESRWADGHAWLYETRFALEPGPGERVHLVMEGVDYQSWTYLNGQRLSPEAGHEGMFSRQLYEVTEWIGQDNALSVLLQGSDHLLDGRRRNAWERLLDRAEPGPPHQRQERFQTVKCQMGFGWDFAPCVRSMGVWDDVYLVRSGEVYIRDLWVVPLFEEGVSLRVTVTLDAARAGHGGLRLALSGHNFACPPQVHTLDAAWRGGVQALSWTLPVEEPRLWWPWDRGPPNLYRCAVEAYLADGTPCDAMAERVGLRQVTVKRNPGAPPQDRSWVIHVNGEPLYVRGANWVPADILPGQVTADDYRALLHAAREAHMNALRVWGGGLREKRAFYDLCDEMGLLVWQEFPLACAFLTHYPRGAAYLDLAEREGRAIVRALRNHPSVALWCGGNEFHPGRHRRLVDRLSAAVREEDGTRPFSPASPNAGDVHNWQVWHGLAPVTEYRADRYTSRCRLASEFGLQAPPDVESLRAFIPAGDLWPPGPAWEAHSAQLPRLARYARPLLRREGAAAIELADVDLDTFVSAAQRAQAIGLQIAIEHLRRKKYACSGALVWQLNEPWPAISWSLVDYERRPKPAYQAVRRAYNPLLVSLEYPIRRYADGDPFAATIWVLNDRNLAYPGCCVQVALLDGAGQAHESWLRTMSVGADSARAIAQVEWELPEGGGWTAVARLFQGDDILSENAYDLSFYDAYQMPTLRRIRRWLTRMAVGAGS